MTVFYDARDMGAPAGRRPRRLARARARKLAIAAACWLVELMLYAAGLVTVIGLVLLAGVLAE